MPEKANPTLKAWLQHRLGGSFGRFLAFAVPALLGLAGLAIATDVHNLIGIPSDRQPLAQRIALGCVVMLTLAQIVLQWLSDECKAELQEANASRAKIEKDCGELRDTVQTIGENMKGYLDGMLLDLAVNRLKFPKDDGEGGDRISLYAHTKKGFFRPMARFSFNPRFKDVNRATYPEGQGFINCAWEGGRCYEPDLPDPETAKVRYLKRHTDFGVPEDVVEKLRMKSRLYYGIRLDAKDATPMAVIVVESVNPTRWSEQKLIDIFEDEDRVRLAELVAVVYPYFGREDDLSQKGL